MKRDKTILPVIGVLRLYACYTSCPQSVFVRQQHHDKLATTDAANSPGKSIASGKFHQGAHPTSGTPTIYRLARAALVEGAVVAAVGRG